MLRKTASYYKQYKTWLCLALLVPTFIVGMYLRSRLNLTRAQLASFTGIQSGIQRLFPGKDEFVQNYSLSWTEDAISEGLNGGTILSVNTEAMKRLDDDVSDAKSLKIDDSDPKQNQSSIIQTVLSPESNQTLYTLITPEDIPSFRVEVANCARLFSGDERELLRAEAYQRSNPKHKSPDAAYIRTVSNCEQFLRNRKYVTSPVTAEEEEFPIAFSLLVFKDMEQVERLLRAIYRPQNYYCIHIDAKSPSVFRRAVETLASCFENVFISSRSVRVQWGGFSVLEPELICMEELWKYKKWKYFINLTGQEFPLKTNWDLVKILKAYNGANDLEGTVKRYV